MSTNFHTPHAQDYNLTKANWNRPLSQLDSVLTGMMQRTQAFTKLLVGTGSLAGSQLVGGETDDSGDLLPRMTTTQRDAISSPAAGLMIFNITTDTVDFYDGSDWYALASTTGTPIQTVIENDTLSNVASVSITSIPSTYLDLVLFASVRSRRSANRDDLWIRFNGDTGTLYRTRATYFETGGTFTDFLNTTTEPVEIRQIPAANADTYSRSAFILTIPRYSKAGTSASGFFHETMRATNTEDVQRFMWGRWHWRNASSTVISQIDLVSANGANLDIEYTLIGRGLA